MGSLKDISEHRLFEKAKIVVGVAEAVALVLQSKNETTDESVNMVPDEKEMSILENAVKGRFQGPTLPLIRCIFPHPRNESGDESGAGPFLENHTV